MLWESIHHWGPMPSMGRMRQYAVKSSEAGIKRTNDRGKSFSFNEGWTILVIVTSESAGKRRLRQYEFVEFTEPFDLYTSTINHS